MLPVATTSEPRGLVLPVGRGQYAARLEAWASQVAAQRRRAEFGMIEHRRLVMPRPLRCWLLGALGVAAAAVVSWFLLTVTLAAGDDRLWALPGGPMSKAVAMLASTSAVLVVSGVQCWSPRPASTAGRLGFAGVWFGAVAVAAWAVESSVDDHLVLDASLTAMGAMFAALTVGLLVQLWCLTAGNGRRLAAADLLLVPLEFGNHLLLLVVLLEGRLLNVLATCCLAATILHLGCQLTGRAGWLHSRALLVGTFVFSWLVVAAVSMVPAPMPDDACDICPAEPMVPGEPMMPGDSAGSSAVDGGPLMAVALGLIVVALLVVSQLRARRVERAAATSRSAPAGPR